MNSRLMSRSSEVLGYCVCLVRHPPGVNKRNERAMWNEGETTIYNLLTTK